MQPFELVERAAAQDLVCASWSSLSAVRAQSAMVEERVVEIEENRAQHYECGCRWQLRVSREKAEGKREKSRRYASTFRPKGQTHRRHYMEAVIPAGRAPTLID